MAISLNSVMSFNSTLTENCESRYPSLGIRDYNILPEIEGKLQPNYQDASRYSVGASLPKATMFTPFLVKSAQRMHAKEKRPSSCLSVADSDQLAEDTDGKNSGDAERTAAGDQSRSTNPPVENVQFQASANPESKSEASDVSNGSAASANSQSTMKKSPLTARERLRAARVLSRYTESKESSNKSDMGSRVLDALKESDRGKKRSRLPEAPTNLFDDSKRGLPKPGLTFHFPGGFDLFIIVFSFVFISTLMFATTYFVWKVGAIHFNEY